MDVPSGAPDLCGSLSYIIATDINDGRVTFDDVDTISLNTNGLNEEQVTVTITVQNAYHSEQFLQTTIKWLSCEGKTPTTGTFTGTLPEIMFDFWTDPSPADATMSGSEWSFSAADSHCYVDHYRFECTDPNGVAYSISSSDGEALSIEIGPNETGPSSLCSAFDVTLLHQRTVQA